MLWHFPALQLFTWPPLLWTDHRLLPAPPGGESGKDFSRISADPAHGSTAPAPGEGLQGCIHLLCEGSSLFQGLQGLEGNVTGLKSVLLLWSGRAELGAALLLSGRSAAGTGASCETGLALHSCTSIHAALGELLKMFLSLQCCRIWQNWFFWEGREASRPKTNG